MDKPSESMGGQVASQFEPSNSCSLNFPMYYFYQDPYEWWLFVLISNFYGNTQTGTGNWSCYIVLGDLCFPTALVAELCFNSL